MQKLKLSQYSNKQLDFFMQKLEVSTNKIGFRCLMSKFMSYPFGPETPRSSIMFPVSKLCCEGSVPRKRSADSCLRTSLSLSNGCIRTWKSKGINDNRSIFETVLLFDLCSPDSSPRTSMVFDETPSTVSRLFSGTVFISWSWSAAPTRQ